MVEAASRVVAEMNRYPDMGAVALYDALAARFGVSRLTAHKAVVRLQQEGLVIRRGKGGTATLYVNGKNVAQGRIAHTTANVFSVDEGVTVGVDDETAVTTDYKVRDSRFTGQLGKIVVDVK